MRGKWRKFAKQLFQWAIIAATVVALVRVGREQSANLRNIDPTFNLFWLFTASVAISVANLFLPLGWRRILKSLGQTLATGRAVRLWCVAQSARYVPSGILAIVSRLQLAAKEGIPKSITATSTAIETFGLLGWAILTFTIFMPSEFVPGSTRLALGSGGAIALMTAPLFFPYFLKRLPLKSQTFDVQLNRQDAVAGLSLLGISVAIRAAGTVCLAAGFLDLQLDDVTLIIGATYGGVVAGMIGITPAGLGVREGVMAALLASRFGLSDAAAFAIFLRAWEFAIEIAFLAFSSWWGRAKNHESSISNP